MLPGSSKFNKKHIGGVKCHPMEDNAQRQVQTIKSASISKTCNGDKSSVMRKLGSSSNISRPLSVLASWWKLQKNISTKAGLKLDSFIKNRKALEGMFIQGTIRSFWWEEILSIMKMDNLPSKVIRSSGKVGKYLDAELFKEKN